MLGLDDEMVEDYYDYMMDTAKMFGAEDERAVLMMLDVLNFEIALANVRLQQLIIVLIILIILHYPVHVRFRFPKRIAVTTGLI